MAATNNNGARPAPRQAARHAPPVATLPPDSRRAALKDETPSWQAEGFRDHRKDDKANCAGGAGDSKVRDAAAQGKQRIVASLAKCGFALLDTLGHGVLIVPANTARRANLQTHFRARSEGCRVVGVRP